MFAAISHSVLSYAWLQAANIAASFTKQLADESRRKAGTVAPRQGNAQGRAQAQAAVTFAKLLSQVAPFALAPSWNLFDACTRHVVLLHLGRALHRGAHRQRRP